MVDDDTGDMQGSRTASDATWRAHAAPGGFERHPLFPPDDDDPEDRDICYISLRRRASDGSIETLYQDLLARDILSWSDVLRAWGGGEYRAIAKDRDHRIVAWVPEGAGEWIAFLYVPAKPFTLPGERHQRVPPDTLAAPRVVEAAPPPPAPDPVNAELVELLGELRRDRLLRESREPRAAQAPSLAAATRPEFQAQPAPAPSAAYVAMVEVLKSQSEHVRRVLIARAETDRTQVDDAPPARAGWEANEREDPPPSA